MLIHIADTNLSLFPTLHLVNIAQCLWWSWLHLLYSSKMLMWTCQDTCIKRIGTIQCTKKVTNSSCLFKICRSTLCEFIWMYPNLILNKSRTIFLKFSHFYDVLIREMDQGFDSYIVQFQWKIKAIP